MTWVTATSSFSEQKARGGVGEPHLPFEGPDTGRNTSFCSCFIWKNSVTPRTQLQDVLGLGIQRGSHSRGYHCTVTGNRRNPFGWTVNSHCPRDTPLLLVRSPSAVLASQNPTTIPLGCVHVDISFLIFGIRGRSGNCLSC